MFGDIHTQPVRLGHCLSDDQEPIARTAPMPRRFSFEPPRTNCRVPAANCTGTSGPPVQTSAHNPIFMQSLFRSSFGASLRHLQLLDSEQYCLNPSLHFTSLHFTPQVLEARDHNISWAAQSTSLVDVANNHHEPNPFLHLPLYLFSNNTQRPEPLA